MTPTRAAGRHLVLAILVYITLDLSLASMPGAFVFEVEDSVESLQMNRSRPLAPVAIASLPPRDSKTLVVRVDSKPRTVPRAVFPAPIRAADGSRVLVSELPAVSEDPH
jgi:hypothetical protein